MISHSGMAQCTDIVMGKQDKAGKAEQPVKRKVGGKREGAGRPSDYTPQLADKICHLISRDYSVRRIGGMPDMPHEDTIQRWIAAKPDFAVRCAHAREAQADHVFDANAMLEDQMLRGEVPADVGRAVISSRQWRAAKLAPKKYGDKQQHEHSGPNGGAIPVIGAIKLVPLERE